MPQEAMGHLPASWGFFIFALFLWGADGSQLLALDPPAPPPLLPLPHCGALKNLSCQTRQAASGKLARLLRKTVKNAEVQKGETKPSRPLVVAVCRPIDRSPLRTLLGCLDTTSTEVEQEGELDSDVPEKKQLGGALDAWWKPEWQDLCNAAGIGLDLLPSGASLLTVELPTPGDIHAQAGLMEESSTAEANVQTAVKYQGEKALKKTSEDSKTPKGSSVSASKEETANNTNEPSKAPLYAGVPCATEAALLAALAAPLVETADVLLVSLLHRGVSSPKRRPALQQARQFGELLSLEAAKEKGPSGAPDPSADATHSNSSSGNSLKACLQSDGSFRLPEDVLQLLRAMRQLVQPQTVQEAAGDTAAQTRVHQQGKNKQHVLKTRGSRHLPHIVLLLGGAMSPAGEAAIRAEVSRHLGDAQARVSILSVTLPEGEGETSAKIDRLIRETRQRGQGASQVADLLAPFFTGSSSLGSPSSVELPSRVKASNVCAAAARRVLAASRKRLSGLQGLSGKGLASQPFGMVAERLLSEALRSYDSQTRRYQLSSERKLLRGELQRSLERDLRSLYMREALRIERDARARLREALVVALKKDARRFGAVAHGILKAAVTSVDEQLMRLLTPTAVGMARLFKQSADDSQGISPVTLEQLANSEVLGASATAAQNAWLCHNLSASLLELHLLLLHKITTGFSRLAVELSRSPLAALLRQQRSRPWLGVSLRPSLSVTTLLRMRGDGNLQGYSRYNAGAVNLLFGFTNDGEGLGKDKQTALRMQPKLHLDVEVD